MFRFRYVFGPSVCDETGHTIPLLPELDQSLASVLGSTEFGMDGLRRAMLATDALEDTSTGLHTLNDSALDYDTDSLQLTDCSDVCKLSQMRLQSSIDPILHNHDRHLDDDDRDVMYTELTNRYREFSPGSTGDSSLEQELSDCSSSESGLGSPTSAVQWETIAEYQVGSAPMDSEGPLPPVTDILAHRRLKDEYLELNSRRSMPFLIKAEIPDSEDDSMDCATKSHIPPPLIYAHPSQLHYSSTSNSTTITATTTTTTTSSNHHDYTTMAASVDENNNQMLVESFRSMSQTASSAMTGLEKGQRKKPGRKKGQVSKVLHLWEFIRDLLSDPNYCPRIINWENEKEGVFRVLHSSEVARLWGEKKKNKKTMTYEKLSRSLRYSRKEGYFDALPKDRGYPKKLCFKFGPKSHGWREYKR